MNMRNFLFILILLLGSCGTNRKFVGDEDKDTAIEEIKRDIASTKEITVSQDPPNPSLWTGKGTDSYLFSNTAEKKIGDIIMVDVYKNLRNEISTELSINEKTTPYEGPESDPQSEKKEPEKPEVSAEATGPDDTPSDQISTVVEEEVNQTHLLLKGKKSVVYKGRKKLLELKALVAKKDIQNNDRVNSKNILESTIKVLR